MKKPGYHHREQDRLAALYSFDVLDTPTEQIFDNITQLAATICDVPYALINLIDENRAWFKSAYGIGSLSISPRREDSICSHNILQTDFQEISDTTNHEIFCDDVVAGQLPPFRFYAGMPLLTREGLPLGVLCVFGTEPKTLNSWQRQSLRQLAQVVMALFEKRKLEKEHTQQEWLQEAEKSVLTMMARGEPLRDVLEQLIRLLETQLPDATCSLMLLNPEKRVLDACIAPGLPPEFTETLMRSGVPLGPDEGSCGTAAHLGEPVIVEDIATDPRWAKYRDLAGRFGLRACWSTPIYNAAGQVVATFALYYRSCRRPAGHEKGVIEMATHLAGIAIERHHIQLALAESQERFRTTFEHAAVGLVHSSLDNGTIQTANPAFCALVGYSLEELKGMSIAELTHPDDREATAEYFRLMRTGKVASYHLEKRYNRKDGGVIWVDLTLSVHRNLQTGNPEYLIGVVEDITQRKASDEQIQFMATHDPLTHLPNRNLLDDRMRQAISHALRQQSLFAVLFLDLDRFKLINDSLGHDKGDILLQGMAERLRQSVAAGDTVARLGGDEFVIVLEDLQSPEDAAKVAERILSTVGQPIQLDEHELIVSTSIGISIYPTDGNDMATLLKKADTAMYKSKASGKNRYHFYGVGMEQNVFERLLMESGLRRALENNEFMLAYQPKVCSQTGKWQGVEALLRWRRSDGSLVSPGEFISVAEEIGLIVPIGEWVIRKACADLRHWHEQGITDLGLALNLSTKQILYPGLPGMLAQAVTESGIDPRMLQLEITESSLMENIDQAVHTLGQIHDLGITLAIDDFGTGYSSLSYLKTLPIQTLKIDTSFIDGLPLDANDAAIVSATLAMARHLGLSTVAEGVENPAQAEFLARHGCDELQGYLYGRPGPADTVLEHYLLARGEAPAPTRTAY